MFLTCRWTVRYSNWLNSPVLFRKISYFLFFIFYFYFFICLHYLFGISTCLWTYLPKEGFSRPVYSGLRFPHGTAMWLMYTLPPHRLGIWYTPIYAISTICWSCNLISNQGACHSGYLSYHYKTKSCIHLLAYKIKDLNDLLITCYQKRGAFHFRYFTYQ